MREKKGNEWKKNVNTHARASGYLHGTLAPVESVTRDGKINKSEDGDRYRTIPGTLYTGWERFQAVRDGSRSHVIRFVIFTTTTTTAAVTVVPRSPAAASAIDPPCISLVMWHMRDRICAHAVILSMRLTVKVVVEGRAARSVVWTTMTIITMVWEEKKTQITSKTCWSVCNYKTRTLIRRVKCIKIVQLQYNCAMWGKTMYNPPPHRMTAARYIFMRHRVGVTNCTRIKTCEVWLFFFIFVI